MADVSMGNIYELNQSALSGFPPLNADDIRKGKKKLEKYFANSKAEYYMLLCRELYDYTLYTIDRKHYNKSKAAFEVIETLLERGEIVEISQTEDKVAYELWVIYNEDKTAHVYYLFPYDNAVIHC